MTDIEQKALALINGTFLDPHYRSWSEVPKGWPTSALCRAIEQHEAFRQEVSDAAREYEEMGYPIAWEGFEQFIIPAPKPDPLREIAEAWGLHNTVAKSWVEDLRAALEARGFEIREKSDD